MLTRFGMSDCKPVSTPLVLGDKLTMDPDADDDGDHPKDKYPFRELIGALMYAATATRPDIMHAVSALSQFNSCYSTKHWVAAKRVLRYLRGTDHRLTFSADQLPLQGFADADWGNCVIDRRSYTGFTFILSGAAVTWESRKQRTVALSSTEAEYMAISDATKEAMYLKTFLEELGHKKLAEITLFNDNRGANCLAENPIYHARSKHIDLRHHYIRQVLGEKMLKLSYLPTEEMLADVLTKPLPGPKHSEMSRSLGLKPGP